MWSLDFEAGRRHAIRIGIAGALSVLLTGCFQPLYGERSLLGGDSLRSALAAVDIEDINAAPATPQARLAIELRNELTFLLNGGAGQRPPTHRLRIKLLVYGTSLIVDPLTSRPEYEIAAINANFQLVEIASTKIVFDDNASARVSYNIPGQQQRFQALRGQREAQSRAAKVIAEQIRTRLASYFAAGS